MFNITFENKNGLQLHFTESDPFTIKDFSGLNPPKATINTNTSALTDGGTFNSSKLQMRSINIAFAIENDAEANRLEIYKVVQTKNPLRIYYKSDRLDIFIDGYVESLDITYWAMKQVATVSVLCPFPYWKAASEIISDLSNSEALFHFAFASTEEPEIVFGEIYDFEGCRVENAGNVKTGLIFRLYMDGDIENPKIIDYDTGEYMQVNYSFAPGDVLTIDTTPGSRSVTLLRNQTVTNLFKYWDRSGEWLQLDVNGGVYVYESGSGSTGTAELEIEHFDLFEGV